MSPRGYAPFGRCGLKPAPPKRSRNANNQHTTCLLAGFPSFRIAVHGNGAPAAGFPTCRTRVQANCDRNSDNLPAKAENPCTGRQQLGKPAAKSRNRCTKARQLGKPASSEATATQTRKTCQLTAGLQQKPGKPATFKRQGQRQECPLSFRRTTARDATEPNGAVAPGTQGGPSAWRLSRLLIGQSSGLPDAHQRACER